MLYIMGMAKKKVGRPESKNPMAFHLGIRLTAGQIRTLRGGFNRYRRRYPWAEWSRYLRTLLGV